MLAQHSKLGTVRTAAATFIAAGTNSMPACLRIVHPASAGTLHSKESLSTAWLTVASLLAVLCCAVLCCAVLCCAVLCCAVLCCAVLCCLVSSQVRNVQREVSRDADIVVAAMISIVGSTLIFQGWRLDPLLLLCQVCFCVDQHIELFFKGVRSGYSIVLMRLTNYCQRFDSLLMSQGQAGASSSATAARPLHCRGCCMSFAGAPGPCV
jgi:hypothetical protein